MAALIIILFDQLLKRNRDLKNAVGWKGRGRERQRSKVQAYIAFFYEYILRVPACMFINSKKKDWIITQLFSYYFITWTLRVRIRVPYTRSLPSWFWEWTRVWWWSQCSRMFWNSLAKNVNFQTILCAIARREKELFKVFLCTFFLLFNVGQYKKNSDEHHCGWKNFQFIFINICCVRLLL